MGFQRLIRVGSLLLVLFGLLIASNASQDSQRRVLVREGELARAPSRESLGTALTGQN